MKLNFITGFIGGAMLFGTAGAIAAGIIANPNPFPVKLNGNDVSIEGYNINGSTYFKLRDVANAVGTFDVDFNNNTIQLSKGGYVYDSAAHNNQLISNNTKKPFADKIPLTESDDSPYGGATVYYDLDFDGTTEKIQLKQDREWSDEKGFNNLTAESIINGNSIVVDSGYKTHGCGDMFVCDIDQTDGAMDIILLTSYKSTLGAVYQYVNGNITKVGNYFPVGGFGEVTTQFISLSVNDTTWQPPGFTLTADDKSYYFEKDADGNYVPK